MTKILAERCPQDHACPLIEKCPSKALSQEGFGAPVVDDELCIECKKCISCCPMNVTSFRRYYE